MRVPERAASASARVLLQVLPARLDVAEERAALDELGDFGRYHGLPGVVLRGDPPQHVAAEDGQVIGFVVVEGDEAAPAGEVVVQRLELRQDPDFVNGIDCRLRGRLIWGY